MLGAQLATGRQNTSLMQRCLKLRHNQSMEFTVRVGEPDVTHRTSWPESTGECHAGTLRPLSQAFQI